MQKELHDQLIQSKIISFPKFIQTKIIGCKRWESSQSTLLGVLLLRLGLKKINKELYNYDWEENYYGKPFLKGADVQFNISHSSRIVVCGLIEGSKELKLGVDIERIKQIDINTVKSQFGKDEWLNISESKNSINSFFKYWTRKESIIKAEGSGLSIPLDSINVDKDVVKLNYEKFFIKDILISDGYSSSIALNKDLQNLKISVEKINPEFLLSV